MISFSLWYMWQVFFKIQDDYFGSLRIQFRWGIYCFLFLFFFFFGYTSYAAFLKEFLFAIFKAHQGNIQFSLPLEWWVWYLSKYVCVCVFLHHPIQWFSFSSQWHLFQGCFISTGVVRDTFLLHFSLLNVLRSLCGKVWESAHIDKLFVFFLLFTCKSCYYFELFYTVLGCTWCRSLFQSSCLAQGVSSC